MTKIIESTRMKNNKVKHIYIETSPTMTKMSTKIEQKNVKTKLLVVSYNVLTLEV